MNKSNDLTVIIGLLVSICLITIFLPITASAELYAATGNPFVGSSQSTIENPIDLKVPAPTLDSGSLPLIDPVVLPKPNRVEPPIKVEQHRIRIQTITGVLYRVSAIGGETTGWAIGMDAPLRLSGKSVREINVAADNSLLRPLQDKQVQAHGRIVWKQGIERGRYPVMVIEFIHELH